jgi:iron-sulfur cluster assembly accessory protein
MTDLQTEQATTTTDGVLLTEGAASKVKALLDQEGRDDLALRVAVQPGGCSGLRYQLFFDERQLDGDVVKDFGGVNVVTDRMSAPYHESPVPGPTRRRGSCHSGAVAGPDPSGTACSGSS